MNWTSGTRLQGAKTLRCARANVLATDRIDLQFGAKECRRSRSRPTVRDCSKLKRILGRLPETDGAPATGFSCRSHYIRGCCEAQWLIALSSAGSVFFALVKAMVFSICNQGLGAVVEHDRVQRRQHSLGCDTTSRPGATHTRGPQFLVHADPERAEGDTVCEGARQQQSRRRLHQCRTNDETRVSCRWSIQHRKNNVVSRSSRSVGCSAKQLLVAGIGQLLNVERWTAT